MGLQLNNRLSYASRKQVMDNRIMLPLTHLSIFCCIFLEFLIYFFFSQLFPFCSRFFCLIVLVFYFLFLGEGRREFLPWNKNINLKKRKKKILFPSSPITDTLGNCLFSSYASINIDKNVKLSYSHWKSPPYSTTCNPALFCLTLKTMPTSRTF